MKVIGVAGYARAGKDTFCAIAKNILESNGFNVKQFSFAEQLKREVAPFLNAQCGVDVYTPDSELKKDFRDFLVWYGTTWWRKRDPERWIRAVDVQMIHDGDYLDVALVSDVRYPNEGEWVHGWHGFLVHVAAYRIDITRYERGGEWITEHVFTDTLNKVFFDAPNEQERINDPIVKDMADYRLEWEAKGLTFEQAVKDKNLKVKVLEVLNSMSWFNGELMLKEPHFDKS